MFSLHTESSSMPEKGRPLPNPEGSMETEKGVNCLVLRDKPHARPNLEMKHLCKGSPVSSKCALQKRAMIGTSTGSPLRRTKVLSESVRSKTGTAEINAFRRLSADGASLSDPEEGWEPQTPCDLIGRTAGRS